MTDDSDIGDRSGELSLRALAARFNRAFYDAGEATWAGTHWLGVPVARYPTDLIVLAEIIAETEPDLVIESGVFKGGGSLFIAGVLDAIGAGRLVGVDIDLSGVPPRVPAHPRIELIEGSSTDPTVHSRLLALARGRRTMVILDSDHSASHVDDELRLLAPLVSPGCYLLVEDTAVGGRPVQPEYGPGPAEALHAFLPEHPEFVPDPGRERFELTTNPGGYLRRRPADEKPGAEAALVVAASAGPEYSPLTDPGPTAPNHPSFDELQSLRIAVRKMSERDRLIRAAWDRELHGVVAGASETAAALRGQLRDASALIAEKDRQLAAAQRRAERIESVLPFRAALRLRRILIGERFKTREVGPARGGLVTRLKGRLARRGRPKGG